MKNTSVKSIAALALACVFAFPRAVTAAGEYKALSARIVKCALANSVAKIAVLGFSAKGGAGQGETEYVAERVGLALAGNISPALIERDLLDKVFKEARLASAAGAADGSGLLREIFSIDAVVTGTVFADGEFLKVLTKLIDIKTGRILLAVETDTRRREKDLLNELAGTLEPPEVEMPELPDGWGRSRPRSGGGLRDAVAEPAARSCADRRLGLNRLNAELVEIKAWYWAEKMREPGFSSAKLTRNPGSEIGDAGVKARFYSLLAAYSRAAAVPPEPENLTRLLDLMKQEKQVSDDCGLF
ncbi:MAG TPA: hypothetical protein PKI19_02955 [Elusimicrobiales bacterium]|nr:hypothetical protein [Elusimicrobiales bacterium]